MENILLIVMEMQVDDENAANASDDLGTILHSFSFTCSHVGMNRLDVFSWVMVCSEYDMLRILNGLVVKALASGAF